MTDWDGFIYMLKVPLQITITEDDKHPHVVQVGMVEGSWPALSRRLYQHMFAWTRVTSTIMNGGYPSNAKDAASSEWLRNIKSRKAKFPDLIGLIPRDLKLGEDEEGDDDVVDTEAFVRELVGTKLRRKPLLELLSHNYPAAAGKKMWNNGDLSTTELRVVSQLEYNNISKAFEQKWNTGSELFLGGFVKKVITWERRLVQATLTLEAKYTTSNPSSIRNNPSHGPENPLPVTVPNVAIVLNMI